MSNKKPRQLSDGQIKAIISRERAEADRQRQRADELENGVVIATYLKKIARLQAENDLLKAAVDGPRSPGVIPLTESTVFKRFAEQLTNAQEIIAKVMSVTQAILPFEAMLQRISEAAESARGELQRESVGQHMTMLTETYQRLIQVADNEDKPEFKRLYALFLTGAERIVSGEDNGEYLREVIKEHTGTESILAGMRSRMAGGNEPAEHVDLIASIANRLKSEGFSWKEIPPLVYRELMAVPQKEERHRLAISQLETYGNFWDSKVAGYSHDNLEKAVEYIRKTANRRK